MKMEPIGKVFKSSTIHQPEIVEKMDYGKVVLEKSLKCWKIVEVKNLGKVEFRRVQEIWERWNSKRIQNGVKWLKMGITLGKRNLTNVSWKIGPLL